MIVFLIATLLLWMLFGKDDTFVGRIRRDFSVSSGVHLWVVADNLRKGAASNAVQILEKLILDF